ncbi:MAG: type VI secretion system accessory protein TagJ [Gemmobacter sp.]|nr:type VI secretion system accessory protein TagJ [Gemmobacter sp.]
MTQDATAHLKAGDPDGALAALQAQVRANPGDSRLRIFLFQLLCVQGDWKRAVSQLKLCAELDPSALPMAQTYREAIICEVYREKVFAGEKDPLIFGDPQEWIALLVESLRALAAGRVQDAADLRARAFDAAPSASGELNGVAFDWIADADPRLGPVLEIIVNGKYYWMPFTAIASLRADPPADLRDAVWTAANLTLQNGAEIVALIPTRYPGTAPSGSGATRLARATDWTDMGADTFVGIGQRLLATSAGDTALMDVRALRMDVKPGGL